MDAQDDRWRQAVAYADEWLPEYLQARDRAADYPISALDALVRYYASTRAPRPLLPELDGRLCAFTDELGARKTARMLVGP